MTMIYRNARLPLSLMAGFAPKSQADGLALIDFAVRDGQISADLSGEAERVDLGGRLVLPGFVDAHVHLDKTYTSRRAGVSTSGLEEAVGLAMADLPNRTAEDLRARMDRAIRRAVQKGSVALRTHLDSMHAPSDNPAWMVLSEMRARWQGLITLEAVALMRVERALEESFAGRCADIAAHKGLAGGYIAAEGCPPEAVDAFFRHAAAAGLDVDFHVDESLVADAKGIETVLDSLERTGFAGHVTLSHCCALAAMPEARAAALIARMAEAKVDVVSLPFSNLYLQDRTPGRTGRQRGLTLAQELHAAGVPVTYASDNVQDPFYPYGDYDPLDILRTAILGAQLEQAPEFWIAAITQRPAQLMGLAQCGTLVPGAPADFISFEAYDWTDLFSRAHEDRQVYRAGLPLTAMTLPPVLECRA